MQKNYLFLCLIVLLSAGMACTSAKKAESQEEIESSASVKKSGKEVKDFKKRIEREEKVMLNEVGLSKDQVESYKSVNEKFRTQRESLLADQTMDQSAKSKALKAMKMSKGAEIKELMTEEQHQKYLEWNANRTKNRKGKKEKRPRKNP